MPNKSVFQTLNEYDITPYLKEKNKLSYLPWSSAWMIIKGIYPSAVCVPVKDDEGRIYHTDGKTCWVETSMTIDGETQNETLAVMDFKNKSVTYESITSTDAGKSLKRCMVKNAALFGLGLSLWVGEELSDAAKKVKAEKTAEEQTAAAELDAKRAEITELAKAKMASGVDRELIYNLISENAGGRRNPNSIKDIETANKVYDEINAMGVKD